MYYADCRIRLKFLWFVVDLGLISRFGTGSPYLYVSKKFWQLEWRLPNCQIFVYMIISKTKIRCHDHNCNWNPWPTPQTWRKLWGIESHSILFCFHFPNPLFHSEPPSVSYSVMVVSCCYYTYWCFSLHAWTLVINFITYARIPYNSNHLAFVSALYLNATEFGGTVDCNNYCGFPHTGGNWWNHQHSNKINYESILLRPSPSPMHSVAGNVCIWWTVV